MFKTIKAENIQYRTPLAYRATEKSDPIFGTAYKRQPGVVTIALANKGHVDVRNDERVTISYTPADEDNVKGIRYCESCPEKHLRRILTDKHATAYCDASAKRYRENKKVGKSERAEKREEKAATQEARIASVMTARPRSRDYLVAVALRNAAGYKGRFAAVAKGYGLTVDQAAERVAYHFGAVEVAA
jgi:hypothetical protein